MLPPKAIVRFFVLFCVLYAAMAVHWPGLVPGYAKIFRTMGQAVFSRFGNDGIVRFIDPKSPGVLPPGITIVPPTGGVLDTAMLLRNSRVLTAAGWLRTSSREVAYKPTVIFIALMLATPLPWSRRIFDLILGFFITHLFIALRLWLTLFTGFSARTEYSLYDLSDTMLNMFEQAETLLLHTPTVSYIMPVCIWLLMVARRKNLAHFGKQPVDATPHIEG